MRVSTQQTIDTLIAGMQNQQQIVSTSTNQLSSGQRFTTASQDPIAYGKSLSIRDMQSGVQGSVDALSTAASHLGMSQDVLSKMLPLLQRAQVLAVTQASGTAGTTGTQATLNEVQSLQQQFLALSNQTWEGHLLFAGTSTGVSTAFTMNALGAVTYNGNTQDPTVVVTPTQSVNVSVNGGNAAFSQAFSAFQNFTSALSTNNTAGMQSAIDNFKNAYASMTNLTAQMGGNLHSVNLQKAAYQSLQTQVAQTLSDNESANIAKASTQLNQANIALQAIYSELAKTDNISLVNYLK